MTKKTTAAKNAAIEQALTASVEKLFDRGRKQATNHYGDRRCVNCGADIIPECFGFQGCEQPDECCTCDYFDKCSKMSASISLQDVGINLSQIVRSGLLDGRFKTFEQLEALEAPNP